MTCALFITQPTLNMALKKFELSKNKKTDNWNLVDSKGKTVESFETKSEATTRGTLKEAIGVGGGSVRIKLENGRIQEERTYPKSKDPKTPG